MGTCRFCGTTSRVVSDRLGVCVRCIRQRWDEVRSHIKGVHAETRRAFGLPEEPPRDPEGVPCELCFHRCRIPPGKTGYCGVRQNINGRLVGPNPSWAFVSWYYDPLPTNCVADPVCEGRRDKGYFNLAVFYESCNFNCLYCQNWHFRKRKTRTSSEELLRAVSETVACVCYFGGDPGPNSPHALSVSRRMLSLSRKKPVRICWETNGGESLAVAKRMMELSLASGGCVKVDLKAWSKEVHTALCGVSNEATLRNFEVLAGYVERRPHPPPLVASTLLVPGYVDEEEVEGLARFISSLNPKIPWALLAFYPTFYLDDLPTTSSRHANAAVEIARSYGIENVRVGNLHLLGREY